MLREDASSDQESVQTHILGVQERTPDAALGRTLGVRGCTLGARRRSRVVVERDLGVDEKARDADR